MDLKSQNNKIRVGKTFFTAKTTNIFNEPIA